MIKWATEYNTLMRGVSACQVNRAIFGNRYRRIRMPAKQVLELLGSRRRLESPVVNLRDDIPSRYTENYRDDVEHGVKLVPPVIFIYVDALSNGEHVLVYSSGGGAARVVVAIENGETEIPVDLFSDIDFDAIAQLGLDIENPAIYTVDEYHALERSTRLADEIGNELEESARRLVS